MSYNPWTASAPPQLVGNVQGAAQTGVDQYNLQQWAAYQQQYAQWNAQYGEQFRKEMAAKHGANAVNIPGYNAPITYGVTPTPADLAAAIAQPPPPPPPEEDRPPAPGEQSRNAQGNDQNEKQQSNFQNNDRKNWNQRQSFGGGPDQNQNAQNPNQRNNQGRNQNRNNQNQQQNQNMGKNWTHNQQNRNQNNQQNRNQNQQNPNQNQNWGQNQQNRGRNSMCGRNNNQGRNSMGNNWNDNAQNRGNQGNNWNNNFQNQGRNSMGRNNWEHGNDNDFNNQNVDQINQEPAQSGASSTTDATDCNSQVAPNLDTKGNLDKNAEGFSEQIDSSAPNEHLDQPNDFGNPNQDNFGQRNNNPNMDDSFDNRNQNQDGGFGNRGQNNFGNRGRNNRGNRGGRNQNDNMNRNRNPFGGGNNNQNFNEQNFGNRNQNQQNQNDFNEGNNRFDGNNFNRNNRNQRNPFNQNQNQNRQNQGNPFNQGNNSRNSFNQNNNFNDNNQGNRPNDFESRNRENSQDRSFQSEGDNSPEEIFFREQFRKWEDDYNNWKQDNYNRLDRVTFESYQRQFEDVRNKLMDKWELMRMRKRQQQQQQNPQVQENSNTQNETPDVPVETAKSVERVPTPQEQKDTFDEDYDENYTNFEKKEEEQPKMSTIFNKPDGIPGLDLVPDKEKANEEEKSDTKAKSSIPSLFDIVIEKPVGFSGSIEINSDDEDVSAKKTEEEIPKKDIGKPDETTKSEIPANVLQDPKLLGMLSAALATAKGQPVDNKSSKNSNETQENADLEGSNQTRFDDRNPGNRQDFEDQRGGRFSRDRFDNQGNRFGNYDNQSNRFDGPGGNIDNRFDDGNVFPRYEDPQGRFNSMQRGSFGNNGGPNNMQDRFFDRQNDMPGGRFNNMPGGRLNNFPEGRLDDMQRGRFDDMQRGRFDDMPRGRFDEMPRGRFDDMQGGRFNDMPGGRFNDMPGGRFNDMPGGRFNDTPGGRFNDTPGGRFNDMPGGRFNDTSGGRFDERFSPNMRGSRFDDHRNSRGSRFDYRGNEDNMRNPRNPFGNPPPNAYDNRSGNYSDRLDRKADDEYFKPAKVIDYGNKPASRFSTEDTFVPAKVIDHSNKPKNTSKFDDDYFPMKTIDYSQKNAPMNNEKITAEENTPSRKRPIETKSTAKDDSKKVKPDEVPHTPKTVPTQPPSKKENIVAADDIAEEIKDKQIEKFSNPEAPNYHTSFGTSNIRQNIEPPLPPQITNTKPKPTMSAQDRKLFFEQQIADLEHNQNQHQKLQANSNSNRAQNQNQAHNMFNVNANTSKPQSVYPTNENCNTISVNEILLKPGRQTRPKNIVVILRGPPGSGKSYVAKLIKQKEIEQGGDKSAPRILSIDDYFMIEDDIEEKCPKTGRKIFRKEMTYEYDPKMENTYMQYLIKAFKKNTENGLFKFIIIDCCNNSLITFTEFYNIAKNAGYTPYTVDLFCDIDFCLKHNIHNHPKDEIKRIIDNWNPTPFHYIKLDVSSLTCSDDNIQDIIDVDMEDVSDCEEPNEFQNDEKNESSKPDDDDSDSNSQSKFDFLKSKWDDDEKKLERLDGTVKFHKRKASTMSEYLQLDDWVPTKCAKGKKRVRWADLEEKREQEKMREMGFVVGLTDWNRMMDPTEGSGALTQTKYIERANKGRSVR